MLQFNSFGNYYKKAINGDMTECSYIFKNSQKADLWTYVLDNFAFANFRDLHSKYYQLYIKNKQYEKYCSFVSGCIEYTNFKNSFIALGYNWLDFYICDKFYSSNRQQIKRLKTRISDMMQNADLLNKYCYFVTLTFTDGVLSATSEDTRARKVKSYLKDNCIDYVANIDYGAKNEREHYHCIVLTDKTIKELGYMWSYGANKIKIVHTTTKDSTRLAKYVNKLCAHSVKNTGKPNKLIYSRPSAKYKGLAQSYQDLPVPEWLPSGELEY